jgi:hypothetical protein
MGLRLRLLFGIAALAGGLELAGCQPVDANSTTIAATSNGPAVRCGIDMRNVTLHVSDGVVLRVPTLDGELVATKRGSPPVFDDPASYILRLKAAEMSIDAASLNTLVARVLSGQPSIKELTLSIGEGQVIQKGKLRKGITVPFTLKTSVSPTPDGRVRLHATSLKAIGIPVKGMLDFFGVELASLMKIHGRNGLQIEGDDILLAPAALLPPPATEGVVTGVRVSGDRLVMQLSGNARPPARPTTLPDPRSRNYVYFHGGSVRFGKLTMTDADLQLTDGDPRDPFDFFPNRYLVQLVAGYSRTTPRGGLKVHMPDYSDLRQPKH